MMMTPRFVPLPLNQGAKAFDCKGFLKKYSSYSQEAMDEDDAEEDDEEDEEEEDFSDDDDMSWKVRRAAAKCCSALISQYIDELALMYQKLVPLLLKRFSEREESVRLEVFDTFEVLLRQTSSASHESAPERLLKPINSQIIKAAVKQLRCVAISSIHLSSSGLFSFLMRR